MTLCPLSHRSSNSTGVRKPGDEWIRLGLYATSRNRLGCGWASPKSWYSDGSAASSSLALMRRSAKPDSTPLPITATLIETPRPASGSVAYAGRHAAPAGRSGEPGGGGPPQGHQGGSLIEAATRLLERFASGWRTEKGDRPPASEPDRKGSRAQRAGSQSPLSSAVRHANENRARACT
jgi:hypothetical protein